MSGKTAAPWEIPYSEATDEPKTWPNLQKEQSERIAAIFAEKVLIIKGYSGPATLKSGELAEQNKAGETFTLPSAATANRIIGVFCQTTSCKVTTSGGADIRGDFITAATSTITLTLNQHVLLQSNGSSWLIIAGEPKRTNLYVERLTVRTAEVEYEPSASREAEVLLVVTAETASSMTVFASGEEVTGCGSEGSSIQSVSFSLPAGSKWKYTATKIKEVRSSYRLR